MKTKSAIGQVEELAPRTLKEIVHGEAKTLRPEASVQEACDELRSEGITWFPVTDKNGQLLGTVSESELNRKVGGFGPRSEDRTRPSGTESQNRLLL